MKQKKILKIISNWLPPLLWAILIYLLSSHPTASTSEVYWQDFVVKKIAHIIEYAILATLIYRSFKMSGVDNKESGYYAILICIMYGLSDEFHQSFTPGRLPKLRDVVFDTIGAVLAIYIIWKLLPKAPKKLESLAKKYQLL